MFRRKGRRRLIGTFAILGVVLVMATLAGAARAQPAGEPPTIAAASDLQFAVTEIAAAFTAETGKKVKLSFGSTGNFARQIREGAPFQMFMAADEKFIAELHADGLHPRRGHALRRGPHRDHGAARIGAEGGRRARRSGGRCWTRGTITRFRHRQPGACALRHARRGGAAATGACGTRCSRIWCWARTSARRRSSRCRAMPRAASSPIRWRWRPRCRARRVRADPERLARCRCSSAWCC